MLTKDSFNHKRSGSVTSGSFIGKGSIHASRISQAKSHNGDAAPTRYKDFDDHILGKVEKYLGHHGREKVHGTSKVFDIDDESTDKMYNSVQAKTKEQVTLVESLQLVQLDTDHLHDTIERKELDHFRRSLEVRRSLNAEQSPPTAKAIDGMKPVATPTVKAR